MSGDSVMVQTLKEKAQKAWGQVTPEQGLWITRGLLAMGCGFFCKIAQNTWPGIITAITGMATFGLACFCFIKVIAYTPKKQALMMWIPPFILGGFCNYAVVLANKGFMPSTCQDVADGFYIPMEGARLTFLADWIWTFVSPGDVLMFLAFVGIIATMLVKPRKTLVEQQ